MPISGGYIITAEIMNAYLESMDIYNDYQEEE